MSYIDNSFMLSEIQYKLNSLKFSLHVEEENEEAPKIDFLQTLRIYTIICIFLKGSEREWQWEREKEREGDV